MNFISIFRDLPKLWNRYNCDIFMKKNHFLSGAVQSFRQIYNYSYIANLSELSRRTWYMPFWIKQTAYMKFYDDKNNLQMYYNTIIRECTIQIYDCIILHGVSVRYLTWNFFGNIIVHYSKHFRWYSPILHRD